MIIDRLEATIIDPRDSSKVQWEFGVVPAGATHSPNYWAIIIQQTLPQIFLTVSQSAPRRVYRDILAGKESTEGSYNCLFSIDRTMDNIPFFLTLIYLQIKIT